MSLERVAVCPDCREPSTASLSGVGAFRQVVRNSYCIEVCAACALLDRVGTAGAMTVRPAKEKKP